MAVNDGKKLVKRWLRLLPALYIENCVTFYPVFRKDVVVIDMPVTNP